MEGEESDATDTEVLPRELAEKKRRNERLKAQRASETPEQREQRLAKRRSKAESETPEVRQARLAKRREKEAEQRRSAMSAESSQDGESSGIAEQLRRKNEKARAKRASETPEQRAQRLAKRRRQDAQKRLLAASVSSRQSDDTATEEEVKALRYTDYVLKLGESASATTTFTTDLVNNPFGFPCDVCERLWCMRDLKPESNVPSTRPEAASALNSISTQRRRPYLCKKHTTKSKGTSTSSLTRIRSSPSMRSRNTQTEVCAQADRVTQTARIVIGTATQT
ncbi:hypothetical protein V5799_004413 [Amblyomma americanum]|uniref:Uncharacterized protein n=1 Tax=Amblyomma americanum TaxID=6943 RepID=A0AAQ4D665_AMBAM